jgi:hypothetical protein
VTLKQVAVSQEMLDEGCPVQVVDESRLSLTPAWWIRN